MSQESGGSARLLLESQQPSAQVRGYEEQRDAVLFPPLPYGSYELPAGIVTRITYLLLVLEALIRLLLFDLISVVGYSRVHAFTRSRRVRSKTTGPDTLARVCNAVEEAGVWYVRHVLCLQRSTVTTWMLRRRGFQAELVIGLRQVPIESHAWVEVEGQVVNDRPQYKKFFKTVDRF
jgi:hypothetical protein